VKLIEPQIPKQLKIMVVGDSGVGKTLLVNGFLSDGGPKIAESTVGVDICFKKIKIKENTAVINFALWDLSGKDDFTKIRTEFYGELHGIIYVFDLSKQTSFSNIESIWMKECKKNNGDKLIACLVGNKSDLNKEVSSSTIDAFLGKCKLNYFEVSAKTNENVKKTFIDYGTQVYETLLARESRKK